MGMPATIRAGLTASPASIPARVAVSRYALITIVTDVYEKSV